MEKIKISDLVYVVDWRNQYTDLVRYNKETQKMENIFPIETEIPDYSGVDKHFKNRYEPNLTAKGTINKKEPDRLIERVPVYKNYQWEVLEVFKHPKAGELCCDLTQFTQAQLDNWKDCSRYTEENLLLLASTHTDKKWMKCYIVVEERGVIKLTYIQYQKNVFNAIVKDNLGKWDRKTLIKSEIPKEIISRIYDENDDVLFGSSTIKGLVSYEYLDAKFSSDGKHIYIGCSVSYDRKGNKECPNPKLIKSYEDVKKFFT